MASSVVAAGVSVVRASPRSRATSIRTSCRRPAQNAPLPSIPAILASSGGGRGGFSSVTALVGRTRRRRSTGDSTLLQRGSREEDPPPSTYVQAQSLATSIADAKWFNTYIHGAVFVCILGFLDAGYSRDWSRIGAISEETEAGLRALAVTLGELHLVAATGAGAVAAKRGLPMPPAVAKTLLIGFLAFLEVCFKTVPAAEEA
mmetsp:Transcript_21935/g.35552  ORF Transcript_21935/g.35552 Transcript_21935/m.35552 type:complete len:203 (+) Transcript_21935:87-695(+)